MNNYLMITTTALAFNIAGSDTNAQTMPQNFDDSELTRIGPDDGCINTIGEIIDRYADNVGKNRILMRNYALTILGKIARDLDPNGDALESNGIPSFNEEIDRLTPQIRAMFEGLFANAIILNSFREDCRLDI